MRTASSARASLVLGATLIASLYSGQSIAEDQCSSVASITQGSIAGITQGSVAGITQGSIMSITQGSVAGITQGSIMSITQGSVAGITQGSIMSITQGSVAGITQGSIMSITQGSVAGITQGSIMSITQGSVAGITQGSIMSITQGSVAGITQGSIMSITQGSVAGITQGSIMSITQGSVAGITQGSVAAITQGSALATTHLSEELAQTVLTGPVESIDLVNGVFTSMGQTVVASTAMLRGLSKGDYVSVDGSVMGAGWLYADVVSVSDEMYVPGASTVFVTGIMSGVDDALGSATIGDLTIDYTPALSAGSLPSGHMFSFSGIQPVEEGILLSSEVLAAE